MSLASKLGLRRGMTVRIIGKPDDLDIENDVSAGSAGFQGVIVFARTLAEVDATWGALLDAAKMDRLAWVAYPKAGQLGTDLDRDVLARHLQRRGLQGVRQVAIDEVWSAIRFRPKK
jgi:hypothetical protein